MMIPPAYAAEIMSRYMDIEERLAREARKKHEATCAKNKKKRKKRIRTKRRKK